MFTGVETLVALPTYDAPTVLVAASQADELLGDALAAFPIFVVGTVFGYAALQTAQSVLDVELPEGKEGVVTAVACLGGAVFLVILSNVGVLNFISGTLAKALLDGWNIIANAVLKGAVLNYGAR